MLAQRGSFSVQGCVVSRCEAPLLFCVFASRRARIDLVGYPPKYLGYRTVVLLDFGFRVAIAAVTQFSWQSVDIDDTVEDSTGLTVDTCFCFGGKF